jgi:hypothetical protein
MPNNDYKTMNTAFAAYLRIEGFELLGVEPNNHGSPAVFFFEDDPKIKQCERLWQVGKVEGNLSDFYESYRMCLRMVKVGKL